MHRVYFDTNETSESGYPLWLPKSLEDLKKMGNEAVVGARVVLYMTDELEVDAILEFDSVAHIGNGQKYWIGRPVGEYRMLDGS